LRDAIAASRSEAARRNSAPVAKAKSPFTGIHRALSQLFFDAQKLIVFRRAFPAAGRAGFDLPGICGHGKIGNGHVFGFPRAV
jgi:hypothetical protein